MRYIKLYEQSILTSASMVDWIIENKLTDEFGNLDYNDAKRIGNASEKWKLQNLPLSVLPNFVLKPINNRKRLPIIVLKNDDYEILDGKHRVGEANYLEKNTISAYVGSIEGNYEKI